MSQPHPHLVNHDDSSSQKELSLVPEISLFVGEPTAMLTKAQLTEITDFDKRDSATHWNTMIEKYGGVDAIVEKLKSSVSNGLVDGDDDLVQRKNVYGKNIVPPPPPLTIVGILWETIKEDRIIQILIAGAILILIVGMIKDPKEGYTEGVSIVVALFIVLTVTAGNDYNKDRQFQKILLMSSNKKIKVFRKGAMDQISSWDLVVGDMVQLEAGDEVPADGIFVKAGEAGENKSSDLNVFIDESPLTGETNPVKKSKSNPLLFSGTQVSDGQFVMMATAVGINSSAGKIQEMLNEQQKEATALQLKLKVVGVQIGHVGLVAAIATFLGLVIRWGIELGTGQVPWKAERLADLLGFFVDAVIVVVVAVPEGLPLAVTISLAYSMFKMIDDKCFVRHLNASETMGEANCICTDKTGTLTENRMTVTTALLSNYLTRELPLNLISLEGNSIKCSDFFNNNVSRNTVHPAIKDVLGECISLNSTCFIKKNQTEKLPIFVGSATEGALLIFAEKIGCDYLNLRTNIKKVKEFAFTSTRKRMTVVTEISHPRVPINYLKDKDVKYRILCKGAAEIVLSLCDKQLSYPPNAVDDNCILNEKPLDAFFRGLVEEQINALASQGLRTIVLAYRDVNSCEFTGDTEQDLADLEKNLVFIGLVGIKDPLRPEVPGAVQQCKDAGCFVRMVTGDNVLTASFIAKECGILDDGISIEGPAFRKLADEDKLILLPRLQVLARSSPSDKFDLVRLLKSMDNVVAVTGDGTNDAPALKEADVGFSMGQAGTQIARNASDIILLDDNFASFVRSIAWGRNVLDCVKKFLQFQLSVNVVAICIVFVGSVGFKNTILSPVQLLWVNLVMDSLGALGLASQEPSNDILNRPPHKKTDPLISMDMSWYIICQFCYQMTILLLVLFVSPFILGINSVDSSASADSVNNTRIFTLVFTTFILLQIINMGLAKNLDFTVNPFKGVFKHRLFIAVFFLILIIQILVVQFAGDIANTVPLTDYREWLICIIPSLALIPYQSLCNAILSRYYEDPVIDESDESARIHQDNQTKMFKQSVDDIVKKYGLYLMQDPSKQGMIMITATPTVPKPTLLESSSVGAQGKKTKRSMQLWAKTRTAAFFLTQYLNVSSHEYIAKSPDESFIAAVRKFRH